MSRPRRPHAPIGLEPLEGRALLSATRFALPPGLAAAQFANLPGLGRVKIDPAAAAAITAALRGGPGSEFASFLRQTPNVMGIVRSFVAGQRTEYLGRGAAFKVPKFQEAFNAGPRYDHLSLLAAGAVLQQRGTVFQFGAILLGPYDENATSQLVFGVDRGTGAALGPIFASRPGITPDATVTLTIGPYGANPTGVVTDLATGAQTAIDPAAIRIVGSTVRVAVPAAALPSTGIAPAQYRYAAWTKAGAGEGGIETVGSFSPESAMARVGVQGPVPRFRFIPR
jgi:hypothetical protein